MKYIPLYGIIYLRSDTMIQSLVKAANVLNFLRTENSELTIAEISEHLDLPPSTAHRILRTLISVKYVYKDEKTHLYSLGSGLIPLGFSATAFVNPQRETSDVLKELSLQTGEDSFLIIKSGRKGLVISKVEGKHPLKIVENFGYEIDLHWGAIRKVILAFQSKEFIDKYISEGLSDNLNGKVDVEKLKKELEEIRKNMVSTSNSDYITNAAGIGAPVFNYNGELLGALGIVLPKERMTEENKESFINSVKSCAEKLSKNIGYTN